MDDGPLDPPELRDTEATDTVVVRAVVPMAELTDFFDTAFTTLAEALARLQVVPQGPAFALYRGAPGETADVEVGFPVAEAIGSDDAVEQGRLPAGRLASATYRGGYDGLGAAWGALAGWIGQQGLTPGELMWEVYLTEPTPDMDPAQLRTELNWSIG